MTTQLQVPDNFPSFSYMEVFSVLLGTVDPGQQADNFKKELLKLGLKKQKDETT